MGRQIKTKLTTTKIEWYWGENLKVSEFNKKIVYSESSGSCAVVDNRIKM